MFRSAVFVFLIAATIPLSAQNTPTPIAEIQSAKPITADPPTSGSCICAVYPVYQEGDDIMYYAEICTEATECAVQDVAYYWEYTPVWPRDCRTTAGSTGCLDCNRFLTLQSSDSTPRLKPMAGMSKTAKSTDTIKDNLFPRGPIWEQRKMNPLAGVKSELCLGYLSLTDVFPGKTLYAKLFMVKAVATKAVSPDSNSEKERYLYVAYEVDSLPLSTPENPTNIIAVATTRVAGEATGSGSIGNGSSPFVRNVTLGTANCLVLLQRPSGTKVLQPERHKSESK